MQLSLQEIIDNLEVLKADTVGDISQRMSWDNGEHEAELLRIQALELSNVISTLKNLDNSSQEERVNHNFTRERN